MSILKLPIRNDIPAYTINIELEGAAYIFNFRFNSRNNRWIFDLMDAVGDPIFEGVPLLIELDLVSRFKDDRMPPGAFVLIDESGEGNQPDRLNFSNDISFYYLESNEFEQ